MEINKSNSIFAFSVMMLFVTIIAACSKNDEGHITDSVYSGTGNFNFSGDFNESFIGTVQSTQISGSNGVELLPLSFINSQGKELFIGLKSAKMEARAYNMKDFGSEGYAVYRFSTGLFESYDTGALGGEGIVTIDKINGSQINGSVDMRLARPLNTADTVIVTGSFQLKAQ
jgi:hypothetical protein